MSKIISTNSEIWSKIYYPMRDHFLNQIDDFTLDSKKIYLEKCFANVGLILHRDSQNESWSHIEITDKVDIVELMLKWT
jgi:hypothetical protein